MTAQRANEPASKFDADKPRLDLIAPEFLLDIGRVLDFGARKYGERNWERGMSWSRCYAALQRHMLAWWSGEALDAETGLTHLAHAGCCLMFLAAFEARSAGTDDRAPAERRAALDATIAAVFPAPLTSEQEAIVEAWRDPVWRPVDRALGDEILDDGRRV